MTLRKILDRLGPAYWLTRGAGWLAKVEHPVLKNLLINQFIRAYHVDMSTAVKQQADQFRSFEDFFTRELKPSARTIPDDSDLIVSPVDGAIAACGVYSNHTLIQYKQTTTNLIQLTGSSRFSGSGQYVIIYLSPKDYHRIHVPFNASLIGFSRLGGSRCSVNPGNHKSVQGLYERNVRVNSVWKLPQGEAFFSMVGAMIVSSIQTQWDDLMPERANFSERFVDPIQFNLGDEMGRFSLGSTVILILPDGVGELNALEVGHPIQLGDVIGRIYSDE